jgi:hypothetical protein
MTSGVIQAIVTPMTIKITSIAGKMFSKDLNAFLNAMRVFCLSLIKENITAKALIT